MFRPRTSPHPAATPGDERAVASKGRWRGAEGCRDVANLRFGAPARDRPGWRRPGPAPAARQGPDPDRPEPGRGGAGPAAGAGLAYALLALAAGWVLGPLRELVVAPRLGPMPALMLEAPLMLAACALAARWTARRFAVPTQIGPRAVMGLAALAVLLAAELAGSMALRGLSPGAWLARAATPQGLIPLGLFLLFAAMPLLLRRWS